LNKGSKNIASVVKELITPTADELGYYLWDVEYVKEGADKYLRITIDTEEGVNIEDCEKFHRAIDPLLDEADPIAEAYHLEVSSPGIERELKYESHFAACVGEEVEIRLYAPDERGRKVLRGILAGLEDGNILLDTAEGRVSVPKQNAGKVQTVFDFGD
jgi:ribosome maturation factor RimP